MLKVLHIKNYALLEDLTIEFDAGLTVITGETGAGKSMVVEAIAALCGERIEDLSIRSGKDFVEVTGVFETNDSALQLLEKSGVAVDNEIIIRRRSERGKKQLSYVNDQLVSLNLLKDLTKRIIDLVGQYENQSLFVPHNHLVLLDTFAGLDASKTKYRSLFLEFKRQQEILGQMVANAKMKDEKLDNLLHDIEEITKVNLKPDEEENLTMERNLLTSSEKRSTLAAEITRLIYENEDNVYIELSKARKLLDELQSVDPQVGELVKRIETASTLVDDIYRQITDYLQKIEFSAERLEYVMARLDTISRLKKKYGRTFTEIAEYLTRAQEESRKIQTSDEDIARLNESVIVQEKALRTQCSALSRRRKTSGLALEKKVLEVLNRLGMEKAKFSIKYESRGMSEDGQDDVEFFISTNPGEEIKPLRKVGSGGEISRMTLALKTILSDADRIPTIIFDEVDTGIGGRIAEAVGELLAKASDHHQIICVTHLPQISVCADHHFAVQKEVKDKTTSTRVIKLDERLRTMEIARMLSGKEITKKTMEHAAEILQRGRHR